MYNNDGGNQTGYGRGLNSRGQPSNPQNQAQLAATGSSAEGGHSEPDNGRYDNVKACCIGIDCIVGYRIIIYLLFSHLAEYEYYNSYMMMMMMMLLLLMLRPM